MLSIRILVGSDGALVGGVPGDDFVLNPSYREIERSDLDLVVAGTQSGVVMVEAGASQLAEQDMIEAIDFGYRSRLTEEFAILGFVQRGWITGPGGATYGSSGFIVNCPIVFRFL